MKYKNIITPKTGEKISFDKNKFNHDDIYLYKILTKEVFLKNKFFLNLYDKFSLKKLKSQISVYSTFNIKNQEFENISLKSSEFINS